MGKKVAAGRQRTSRPANGERQSDESGFALIEIICVLAIVGMLAAVVLPTFPLSTSRSRLEAYAVEIASLLKMDRNAARQRKMPVVTVTSAPSRLVRSGATGRVVQLPRDVVFDTLLASSCAGKQSGPAIQFFPSGQSCGGTLSLAIPGARYDVRVNWLTGGIEIVPQKPA